MRSTYHDDDDGEAKYCDFVHPFRWVAGGGEMNVTSPSPDRPRQRPPPTTSASITTTPSHSRHVSSKPTLRWQGDFDDASIRSTTEAATASYGELDKTATSKLGSQRGPTATMRRRQVSANLNCTRIAFVGVLLLCLAAVGLVSGGIVLILTANPQQTQVDSFNAALDNFNTDTASVLLSTTATVGALSGPSVSLSPQYEALVGTPFPAAQSVVLSSTPFLITVPANLGAGQGSLTFTVTYAASPDSSLGQSFSFESPPITIAQSAQLEVGCTMTYVEICGTSTCCPPDQMLAQCTSLIRAFSAQSTVNYLPNGEACVLGVTCGYCEYQQFVSELCFVMQWNALSGWSVDSSMSACNYPFSAGDQTYSNAGNAGATVTLRSSDDPYIVLQQLTQGTLVLDGTGQATRDAGRALLVLGSLALLSAISVVGLSCICGDADVLSFAALEAAFGCAPTEPPPFEDHEDELMVADLDPVL